MGNADSFLTPDSLRRLRSGPTAPAAAGAVGRAGGPHPGGRSRTPPSAEAIDVTVDSPVAQLESAAARGGPLALFGGIEFDMTESESPGEGGEGEEAEVRFGNAEGPIGAMLVDVLDSGDSDDAGLTVGLRGWRLSEAVASV